MAGLRAFEAAARNLGYSSAGRELNITHAAVAQQVRALETHLGVKLAERAGRGIALTPAGQTLSAGLTEGFGTVADTLRALSAAQANRPVHVTMTPCFAVSWFLPRMQLFTQSHPDVDLMVNPTPDLVVLDGTSCDVAIRFGTGDWPGLESEPLVPSNFVIVAAPSLLKGRKITEPSDLLSFHWLQELGTDEVAQWLAGRGLTLPRETHITNLPGYMLLGALREGQGVAATARVFVEGDLADGRLIALFEVTGGSPTAYHLVWRPGRQRPALKAFLRWIRQVASEESQDAAKE